MRSFSLLACLILAAQLPLQPDKAPRYAQPIPMPSDRVADSYAIYSQLLKNGPIEWRDVDRKQWLIEDTTNAVRLDISCGSEGAETSPGGVEPPRDRQAEWNDVLADYYQHCHDVIQLDRDNFRTELPVRLLTAEDKHRFDPRRPPAAFADGAGLHRFTEVFFNANHTLAAVEEGMWCGTLCGNWTWVVLQRRQDRWEMLPWVHISAVS